jgi:uncharacterized protein
MKKIVFIIMIIGISAAGISLHAQSEKKYDSIWEGELNFGTQKLKIIVKIVLKEDGTLTAFLDSPDQGAVDIPATTTTITNDSLKFTIKSLGATYSGKYEKEKTAVTGNFKQGMASIELTLNKVDKLAKLNRPQTPRPPFPYAEEDVTFQNKDANINLGGTLTLPKEAKKNPAVVLVTGSGPQDRDEALFGHKPFLVIADYLTRNGIAVLRYDDRGVGKSKGNFFTATTVDFMTDALSAVEYLKSRKEIDPNKIGIVGHSEGGMVGPLAASNSDNVKFVVMLAGPGMTGKDLIPLQTKLLMLANGSNENEANEQVTRTKEAFDIIVNEPDSTSAYKKLFDLYEKKMSKLSEEEKNKPENGKVVFEGMTKQYLSPWFRFFLKYDPRPTLENVHVPVLAMNGEKDLQVPAKENLPLVEAALKAGGNTKYKIVAMPGLNHLFQTAITGGGSEYGKIEETFSPTALKVIGDWILEITNRM